MSKDRLVVIVSHNLEDAKKYADRIIELDDGKIKSDSSRDFEGNESFKIEQGVLTLPHSTTLKSEELQTINEKLQANEIKEIKQRESIFKATNENFAQNEPVTVNIEHKKMSKRSSLRLTRHFIKKRVLASAITVFVVTALMFILGMVQFLIEFKESETIYSVMAENGETDLLVYNGYYDNENTIVASKCIEMNDDAINEFKDAGYDGKVYKLYNNTLAITTYNNQLEKHVSPEYLIKNAYITESFGTLACDEDYLLRHFGENGHIEVLAGVIDATQNDENNTPYQPHGLIITDYLADSIVKLNNKTYPNYDKIVGKYYRGTYINGIIKTDYREKYRDIFEYVNDINIGIDRSADKAYFKERISLFLTEIQKKYGLAYSTEPNFEELAKYSERVPNTAMNFLRIGNGDRIKDFSGSIWLYKTTNARFDIAENEIVTRYDMFNAHFSSLVGKTYTEDNLDTFEPVEITIYKTDGTEEQNIIYSVTLTIKSLFGKDVYQGANSESCYIWTKDLNLYNMVHAASIHNYGIYLEDATQLDKIYQVIENNPYTIQSRVYKAVSEVGYMVSIFDDLFWLIVLAISVISIVLLVSYAYGNIKKQYYEIGVLKALGATTKNVGFIFSMQTIIAGILISIISTILLLTLCSPINNQISQEVLEVVNNSKINQVTILSVNAPTLLINIGMILLVTIISCLIPILKLNRIKPKNIIASDE